jgi:hypothetical protein
MANTLDHAQEWISFLLKQDLPFAAALLKQIEVGKVTALCHCGCHGFAFEVASDARVPPLQDGKGLFYELAFASNSTEEIDMLLFTDERGYLSWVDVTYGLSNVGPMPEGLIPGAKIGAWPALRE